MFCYIAAFEHPQHGWLTKVGVSNQVTARIRHIGSHYGSFECKLKEVASFRCHGRGHALGMEGMILAKLSRTYEVIGQELVRCKPEKVLAVAETLVTWYGEGEVS